MELAVLGLATSISNSALVVHQAVVAMTAEGVVVKPMTAWRASRQDEARSLADLIDALSNTLDRKRSGAPELVAVKRVESPIRGRPSKGYDQRTRAEGAAMVAAASQGARYFAYRANEIRPRGEKLRELASQVEGYPQDEERRDAVHAACAALSELGAQ